MWKKLKEKFEVARNNRGMGKGMIAALAGGVISLTVLVAMLPSLLSEFGTAGDSLNSSGYPLASFFTSSGVIILMIMAGVVLAALTYFLKKR